MAGISGESLVTSQEYAQHLQEAGEAHSIIRIQNISTQALIGGAIWGVPQHDGHRNKLQPVSISARLSLRNPFTLAAQSDKLNETTFNYSTLSKEILKVVANRRPDIPHSENFMGLLMDWSLFDFIEWICLCLTGQSPSNSHPPNHRIGGFIEGGCPCLEEKNSAAYKPPLLDINKLFELEFGVFLPKATLLSSGVSLTTSLLFPTQQSQGTVAPYRSVLKVHNIRVPTLVGINANERLAKQVVIASVEVDPYVCREIDFYNELEQIVVKSLEESSFETLESLATHLSARVIKYFVYAYPSHLGDSLSEAPPSLRTSIVTQVRIWVEKPSAIMFADAPVIEILRSADPRRDREVEKLFDEWSDLVQSRGLFNARIPFPLQGTLQSWISTNSPGDST